MEKHPHPAREPEIGAPPRCARLVDECAQRLEHQIWVPTANLYIFGQSNKTDQAVAWFREIQKHLVDHILLHVRDTRVLERQASLTFSFSDPHLQG
jgi:hypothetical protein